MTVEVEVYMSNMSVRASKKSVEVFQNDRKFLSKASVRFQTWINGKKKS